MWVYCIDCVGCPMDNATLGVHLQPFNPNASMTAKMVEEGNQFCMHYPFKAKYPCPFVVQYYDGTAAVGPFVRDYVEYNKVTGDHQTKRERAEITFGCAKIEHVPERLGMAELKMRLHGLIGLGRGDKSIINQLGSSGKVRKVFSHCLDRDKGGGIFAIGKVVKPKVEMAKMVNLDNFYALNMSSMEVGGERVDLKGVADSPLTIIDSGTTLSSVPKAVLKAIEDKLFANNSKVIRGPSMGGFTCLSFVEKNISSEYIVGELPSVKFQFTETLSLTISPHEYVQNAEGKWCILWKESSKGDIAPFTFGDTVLSNRLVVYDIENTGIGFTDYDCASGIEIEDDEGGASLVDSHRVIVGPGKQ